MLLSLCRGRRNNNKDCKCHGCIQVTLLTKSPNTRVLKPTKSHCLMCLSLMCLCLRFYTKLHHKIESDMEGWVMRLDESMDAAPLVR